MANLSMVMLVYYRVFRGCVAEVIEVVIHFTFQELQIDFAQYDHPVVLTVEAQVKECVNLVFLLIFSRI